MARGVYKRKKGLKRKPLSKEHKEKIRQINIGNKNASGKRNKKTIEKLSSENSIHWKGNNALPTAMHNWVKKYKGKASNYKCELCNTKQAMDWSNKDHTYKRKLNDYQALCRSCHTKYDYKYNKLYKKRYGKY